VRSSSSSRKAIKNKKYTVNDLNINKIIKGYFNLYLKDNNNPGSQFVLLKEDVIY
jgi:hypothetical protein